MTGWCGSDTSSGDAMAAPFHEGADFLEIGLGQRAFELQVELHALQAERVANQNLRIQAWALHAHGREKVGRLLDDFEDGKHGLSRRRGRLTRGGG